MTFDYNFINSIIPAYITFISIFVTLCYIFRNEKPLPKTNVEWVEDPCIMHKNEEGKNFVAKRDPRSKFKDNKEQNGLRTFTELPYYYQGSPWIVDGYRFKYNLKQAIYSLFQIHNESWNVWTHLAGFFIFFFLCTKSFFTTFSLEGDFYWVSVTMLVFYFGAQILFLASTSFHLFCCMDRDVYSLTAKLDYSAISVMIITSYYPIMMHMFGCNQYVGIVYTVCITVLGSFTIFVSWIPWVQAPEYQAFRGLLFIGLGLFALVPIPHSMYYLSVSVVMPIVLKLALVGFLYISGAVFYIFRVPEYWLPGIFDIYLNSHFIFHCNILLAAYLQYEIYTFLPNYTSFYIHPLCAK